jgi:hypothetical protein
MKELIYFNYPNDPIEIESFVVIPWDDGHDDDHLDDLSLAHITQVTKG